MKCQILPPVVRDIRRHENEGKRKSGKKNGKEGKEEAIRKKEMSEFTKKWVGKKTIYTYICVYGHINGTIYAQYVDIHARIQHKFSAERLYRGSQRTPKRRFSLLFLLHIFLKGKTPAEF